MNETVKRIVDILFQDTVENDETTALHEELMNNCQEHYRDLVARGLSEDEAISEVVDSLKGMKDVIAQYPKKAVHVATEEKAACWTFEDTDSLTVKTTDQDIYVSPSADGKVHVWCDDPEGATCEQNGSTLNVHGAEKKHQFTSAFETEEGEEITLTGILNMVGKAIRA